MATSLEGQKAVRSSLTLCKKVEIIKAVESGEHSKSFVAREFGVAKSTVTDIFKKKDRIIEAFEEVSGFGSTRKRLRTSSYADVEESLLRWLKQARKLDLPISGPAIQLKARELAGLLGHQEFAGSKGWLHRFKARHGIAFRRLSADSKARGRFNGMEDGDWSAEKLARLLVEYNPRNIFCAGETGFFWKARPEEVVAMRRDQVGRTSSELLTVLICTNMTGEEKLPLLVVGTHPEPKLLANVRTLPVLYEADQQALVGKETFGSWLLLVDKKFQQEGRKVAMVLESHPHHSYVQSRLEAIRLIFLPPQSSSSEGFNPCERGIAKTLKINYRKYLLIKLMAALEAKEQFRLYLLDALHLLHLSWVNVSQDTIKMSFSRAGFKEEEEEEVGELSSSEVAAGDALLQQHFANHAEILHKLCFEEYVDIDKEALTSPPLPTATSLFEVGGSQVVSEDLAPSLPPPSAVEAEGAVDVLRRYFQARGGMEQTLNLVAELEKRVLDSYVQPQIT